MSATKNDPTLAALEAYEYWRARKGLPLENHWRKALMKAGYTLPPPVTLDRGDAYEDPIPERSLTA